MSHELQSMWHQFCTELPPVFNLCLLRHINVIRHQEIQLLGFADASVKGIYGSVYLRFVNDADDISVKFVTCKTKVVHLKSRFPYLAWNYVGPTYCPRHFITFNLCSPPKCLYLVCERGQTRQLLCLG